MTSLAPAAGQPRRAAAPAAAASEPQGLSHAAMAWRYLLSSTRARIGLAWTGLVLFLGLFAPLLANSRPLLMRTTEGTISSPAIEALGWLDITLFAALPLALLFWKLGPVLRLLRINARPGPLARLAGYLLSTMLLGLGLYLVMVQWLDLSFRVEYLGQYREMQRDGRIEWAINAPIPYSPTDNVFSTQRAKPPGEVPGAHFGSTILGTDLLSCIIHGSRLALSVGFVSTGIAVLIGITIGVLMGYFAGLFDLLGMRLVEIFESIPTLFLLLAVVAATPPGLRSVYLLMVVIGLTGWSGHARLIRAEILKLRKQEFVQAAVAAGLPTRRILFGHLLRNGIAPVLVTASFGVAGAILAESTLSFLGLVDADPPTWGRLLNSVRSTSGVEFHLAVFPGLFIFMTVLSYNLIGEVLRDILDPRVSKLKG